MTSYVYIDNSNLYIEGCRVSAVNKGMAKSIEHAMGIGIVDHTWQLDYGKLYQFVCGNNAIARLWGSPPPGDSFWNMLDKKGFNPTVYERGIGGGEKKVDVAIGHRMTKDAYTIIDRKKDEMLLVAGDKDFMPVISDLISEGFRVEAAFWDQAAREVRESVQKFISLTPYHAHFTR